MKKLEVGDYVKNLTEKQFKNVLSIEEKGKILFYYPEHDDDFHGAGLMYPEFGELIHAEIDKCKTELTYRQFLLRAKMTFNVARMTQK